MEETADKVIPLLRWIWDLHEKGGIVEAVDESLNRGDTQQLDSDGGCKWQMHRALVVRLWCTHTHPGERMSEGRHTASPVSAGPPDVTPGSLGYNNASTSSANACSEVSWASSVR